MSGSDRSVAEAVRRVERAAEDCADQACGDADDYRQRGKRQQAPLGFGSRSERRIGIFH